MYAIQTGNKFVKVGFFMDPNEVWNLSETATPKQYKTKAEAERVLGLLDDKLADLAEINSEKLATETASVNREKTRLPKLEAKLLDLMELPYKDAVKKIPQVKKDIDRARYVINDSSVISYRKELARVERIRAQGVRVVKLQQTVVEVG